MKSSFNLRVRVLEPITRVLEYLKNVQKSGYPGNRYSALDTLNSTYMASFVPLFPFFFSTTFHSLLTGAHYILCNCRIITIMGRPSMCNSVIYFARVCVCRGDKKWRSYFFALPLCLIAQQLCFAPFSISRGWMNPLLFLHCSCLN